MDEPKDGPTSADAPDVDNTESMLEGDSPTDERVLRKQQVRDKLQQMFGDDSPDTVRNFLSHLAQGGTDGDLPAAVQPEDSLEESKPN